MVQIINKYDSGLGEVGGCFQYRNANEFGVQVAVKVSEDAPYGHANVVGWHLLLLNVLQVRRCAVGIAWSHGWRRVLRIGKRIYRTKRARETS